MNMPDTVVDPFSDLAVTLGEIAELDALLAADMTPDLPSEQLCDLADARARLMGLGDLIVQDWRWRLTQPYPASN